MDCGCGRSPNGKCLGWHDLSEKEYLEKLKEYEKNKKSRRLVFTTHKPLENLFNCD